MAEDANRVTREQYLEMLIDASCWDASEMESGFTSWCERHVPTWRKQGYDETWIRQRIETAQITRDPHRKLKEQGLTMLEIRDELRKTYVDHPELYDLARERERLHPGLLRYRGNTGDLRQRYTLRVMISETEKLTYEKFCRWSGLPVPGPESVFFEQPDLRRIKRSREEAFGRVTQFVWAEEKFQRVHLKILCTIEIHPHLFHFDRGLIDAPRVICRFKMGRASLLQFWCIVVHTTVDRCVIDMQAALEYHLLQVSVTLWIPQGVSGHTTKRSRLGSDAI